MILLKCGKVRKWQGPHGGCTQKQGAPWEPHRGAGSPWGTQRGRIWEEGVKGGRSHLEQEVNSEGTSGKQPSASKGVEVGTVYQKAALSAESGATLEEAVEWARWGRPRGMWTAQFSSLDLMPWAGQCLYSRGFGEAIP